MPMNEIEFGVSVTPVPQSRPRLSRRGAYEESRVSDYKMILRAEAISAMKGRAPFEGLIEMELIIRRNKKVDSRAFGDIDNHIKAVLDALNRVCYIDDAQIADIRVRKLQSKDEGVNVAIKKPSEDG